MRDIFDADGFRISDDGWAIPVKDPPPIAEMPAFFAGCVSNDEAIVKMINELNKPFSVSQHGMDELYERIANALILILANQGGIAP